MKFTLANISKFTACELIGDPEYIITGVADLESATPGDASFFSNPNYTASSYNNALTKSQAGVIFTTKENSCTPEKQFLICPNPSAAFQKLLEKMFPQKQSSFAGIIHPSAIIADDVKIGNNVTVGPHAIIETETEIGDNSYISANAYIGTGVIIGKDCLLYPHVTIREGCKLGDRVIIQPGAVIGSCGFGYDSSSGKHTKIKQLGIVIVEDDVEIGANSTIDRARFGATIIGTGTKIDNLVQIGHGVKIGSYNIIVAQVGIAGSTKTGQYVVIGGQSGINGHIKLDNGVMVAARSGVTKSLKTGKYGGEPAIDIKKHQRKQVYLQNIEKLADRVKILEDNNI